MNTTVKKILLTFVAALPLWSGPVHALTIDYPPPQSYVGSEGVNMIMSTDGVDLDLIRVKVNTFIYPPKKVNAASGTICFGLTLAMGKNIVTVAGYKGKKKVVERELDIFLRSPLDGTAKKKSRKYKEYLFHTDTNEKRCQECHDLNPGLGDLNPARPEDSPCYSCHNNKLARVNQHVPSKKWECLQCHELKKGGQKYSVARPVVSLCYRCHGKKVTDWKKMKMLHGPTGVGQCTLCHDPHGSDFPALSRMQITDLCNNCHVEKETGQHVIAGFFGKGHPTRGVPDPNVPGKEFTCAGCHSPHASNYPDLLLDDSTNMDSYCNGCHKK